MKPMGVISTTALFLVLGIGTRAEARQEKLENQEEKAKPDKQEQTKAPKQEQEARPAKQQEAKAPKQEQQAKPEKQEQARAPKQEQEAKPAKQQEQAKGQQEQQQHQQQAASSQRPQRTPQAEATQRAQPELRLSARGSGRIPDERFRSNFGREHEFRIGNPVLVGGYSRFQYGGYWFGFVEPWPAGWYYTDDVYIDYVDGGYYMYDPYYPGARFAISVVL
jgi:hypothetical protein